jgi:hypothetical protein
MLKTNLVAQILQSAIILNFPRQPKAVAREKQPCASVKSSPPRSLARGAGVGAAVLKGVWVLTVLAWMPLKWVLSLNCVYHLGRMIYYWHTPGMHAGVTFTTHFAVFCALTYFVSCYQPKGL